MSVEESVSVMETSKSKKNALMGPKVLPYEVLNDILVNRGIKNARKVLAKKHGLSDTRIGNIWKEYYGGATLEHYKTGLKRPLPNEIAGVVAGKRQVATPRGKYTADEPKLKVDARAIPRVIKKPIKSSDELELDKLGDLSANALNKQANIIAGQIQAGNDNSELVAAIHELIKNNELLSKTTYSNLLAAQAMIDTKSEKSCEKTLMSNIEDKFDHDDSTQINAAKSVGYASDADDASSTISEEGRSYPEHFEKPSNDSLPGGSKGGIYLHKEQYPSNPSNNRKYSTTNIPIQSTVGADRTVGVRSSRYKTRAKPIHKIGRRPIESEECEEFEDHSTDSEPEQEIYRTKQRARKGSLQPHHSNSHNKHPEEPRRSRPDTRTGGDGPRSNIQTRYAPPKRPI